MTQDIGIKIRLDGAAQVQQEARGVGASLQGIGAAASTLRGAMTGLAGAFAGAVSVREFFAAADGVTRLQNSLQLATGSARAAAQAYNELYNIAQRSRVSFTELGGTFASISSAAASLGVSQQRLLTVTEAIGNAVTISGASAQASQAALTQLGQGLASGTLRGEELNSILEQTPRLAQALADGLGVARGELRKLGEQGAITADQVVRALESQAGVLAGEIKNSTLTVGQAFTQLQNAAVRTVGDFDKATGASAALASTIGAVAGAVESLGDTIRSNETAFKVLAGGLAGAATVAGLGALASGLAAVKAALAGAGAVLAANPALLALLGIGAAVGAGVAYVSASARSAEGIERAIAALRAENERSEAAMARATAAGRTAGADNIAKTIEARRDQIAKLRAELDQLNAAGRKNDPNGIGGGRGTVNPDTVGAMALKKAADERDLLAIRMRLAGVTQQYFDDQKRLQELLASGAVTQKEYNQLMADLANKTYKGADSAKAAAASVDQQGQNYAQLVERIKERIAAQDLENAQGDKLTESQRLRLQIERDVATGKLRAADASKAQTQALLEELAASEKAGEARKRRAAEAESIAEWMRAQDEASAAAMRSVNERIQALEGEEQAAALATQQNITLAEAIEQVAIARLREKQAGFVEGSEGYEKLQLEIKARERILELVTGKAQREAAADAARDAAAEWKKTSDSINQSLTDALLRGFESGKDFAKNLRDTVVNMFKTLVLRPVISAIVNPVAGALTGALGLAGPAAAASGAVGGLSTVGSVASGIGALAGNFGAGLTTGFSTLFSQGLGSSISLGTGLISSGATAGGIGTLAGALGPIALGIGLLASGLRRTLKDSGVQGTLGGAEGFTGEGFKFYKGGFLRSDKTTTEPLDPAVQRGLATSFKAIQDQVRGFADALKLPTDAIGTFTTQIKVSTMGLSEADVQKKFADALATGSNELAQQVIGTWERTTSEVTQTIQTSIGEASDVVFETITESITKASYTASEYAREGEKAIDTLTRLATSLGAVQTNFDALGIAFQDASLSAAAAASNIVDAFGGLERFTQTLGSYFNNFYSDQEKRAAAARQAAKALSAAGLDVDPLALENATRPAIRAAVDAVIAQFGPGSKQAVAAIEQANLLASVIQQPTVQAATAVTDAASEAQRAAEAARRAWQQITDGLLAEQDTLQVALLRAQGREGEALAREREIATRSMDDYQRALYDSNAALRKQIDGLQRAAEAARELGELLPSVLAGYGDTAGAQRLQYGRIAGDLVRAGLSGAGAGELAAALMGMSKDQIAQAALAVYNLTGVTDEMRVALLRAAGSLATLKDEAQTLAASRTDEAFAALERSVQARRSVLEETIADVRAVFDTVRGAARDLFGEVESAVQANAAAGRAFITQALATARTTGYLPDGDQLSEAIGAARAGLSAQQFASQVDADFARLVLANELRDLQTISGDQLTEAEKQLRALDGILENARAQIDELRGVRGGVLDTNTALAELTAAILAERTARGAAAQRPGAADGGAGAGSGALPKWGNFGVGDWMVSANGANVFDATTGMLYTQGGAVSSTAELQNAAAALLQAGQNQQLYDAVRSAGFTLDQADRILRLPEGTAEDWARSLGLPIFHNGTPYVPRTGFAVLEQGEAVIPRALNPWGAGASNAPQMVDELRALRAELVALRQQVDVTNAQAARTADAVNGRPETPMLVEIAS